MISLTELEKRIEHLLDLEDLKSGSFHQLLQIKQRLEKEELTFSEISLKTRKLQNCINKETQLLGLAKRDTLSSSVPDFCSDIRESVERARRIRCSKNVIHLDGRELDLPDIYVPPAEYSPRSCYPCHVHTVLQEGLNKIRPEDAEVFKVRYNLHVDERATGSPGFIFFQWHIAQQLNISQTTVSRRLRRAWRNLCHPYRSPPLVGQLGSFDQLNPKCAAEFVIVKLAHSIGEA